MHELFADYANVAGIIGVFFTLSAYYLLNINRLSSTSITYLALNCVGSSFILYSLMFHWNLSSVITESAWISISLIGIYRVTKARKQKKEATPPNNIYLINEARKSKPAHETISSQ